MGKIRKWFSGILIPDQVGDDDEPVEEVHSKLTDTEQVSITKQGWVSVSTPHSEWGSGETDTEIFGLVLDSNEKFVLKRIMMYAEGGSDIANLSLDVYDRTAGSEIDSVTATGISKTGGKSGTGNEVILRLTNGSGSPQTASYLFEGKIVEV